MIPPHRQIKVAVGDCEAFLPRPLRVFDRKAKTMLSCLSDLLLADQEARKWPDVVSFAWWCRKANIERLASIYDDGALRLGRGVAFHITPNNVPMNFAFSWAFSLVAGNANIVKLPDRASPQISIVLQHIRALFSEGPCRDLAPMNVFLRYGREDAITSDLSAMADVRIIWGGDATIRAVRRFLLPPRGVDIGFPDRYSFAVLGAAEVLRLDATALSRLVTGFFNDTYLMDQNACSSPRLVVWYGRLNEVGEAQERFWTALQSEAVSRYEMAPISAVDKFTQACRDAIELESAAGVHHGDNRLYRLGLKSLFPGMENRRGNCGYFYEYATNDLNELVPIITNKFQTLTYHGISRELLESFVEENLVPGIDRIVPVGAAMDMGVVWDGYDLIRSLSRICDIR